MTYDADVKIPADAEAVIVSPSIVGDRFVQLTPVYTGGAGARRRRHARHRPHRRPLELDQIYQSLDDLTVALGPNGANAKGALTDLLETTAANFGGQGAKFHQTIQDFSQLTGTLDDNKEELFGSAAGARGLRAHAGAATTRPCARSTSRWRRSPTMLAGERGELAARCATWPSR